MRIAIEGAERVAEGVWHATLSPRETAVFGRCESRLGDYSVIVLDAVVDSQGNALELDPARARLVNVGSKSRAVIVTNLPEDGTSARDLSPSEAPAFQGDDVKFIDSLKKLPPELRMVGHRLLSEIRRHFFGQLRYHPRSRKYVEWPDNFWTVTIQPRVRDLLITVRGEPEAFVSKGVIELKADRTGYTSFKLSREDQLAEAVTTIRQAGARGRRPR
jgi:hypothetical protein